MREVCWRRRRSCQNRDWMSLTLLREKRKIPQKQNGADNTNWPAAICTEVKKIPQDFQKAMRLFRLEAERGNALAMYDLGRMWVDGLGVEADPDAAREWYRKALNAFLSAEKELPERKKTYLQYRIGKMYLAGFGTDQDYETAAVWLDWATEKSHKYAQYTLAGLYAKGQGVEKDLKRAFSLYHSSASQGNPYASYELAKMFRDGTGTVKSAEQAEEHFQDAFSGFLVLEEQSHDDKLQYRLGQMLYQGIGTERDEEEAVRYWQQAAKLGNVNAQYALGKFWLDTGTGDVRQAAAWLEKAAAAGNTSALYVLAKLYLEGRLGETDAEKAGDLFQKAAEQGNGFAAYRLGRLYLEGKELPKDMAAAAQGNVYARFLLENLDSFRDPDLILVATRLMHHLSRIFQEDYRKASGGSGIGHIDRRRRRKLQEKRMAQGHRKDDHEPQQSM